VITCKAETGRRITFFQSARKDEKMYHVGGSQRGFLQLYPSDNNVLPALRSGNWVILRGAGEILSCSLWDLRSQVEWK
jgi:hypothetical protein